MRERFRLNIRNHQGVLIGGAMLTMFEPLNATSSMSRESMHIFQVAPAAVWRCGKPFAFDGKQLMEIVIISAFDSNCAQRFYGNIRPTASGLDGFSEKLDGIKTLPTGCAVEMAAKKLIEMRFIV